MLAAKVSNYIQHRDEHRLCQALRQRPPGLRGAADRRRVLRYSEPYLPAAGALGEMTLSVGKAVFHYHQGCDGVVDVSPFGCMNGIVTEAIYPRVSADCDDMPIRNFFFDGTGTEPRTRPRRLHGAGPVVPGAEEGRARRRSCDCHPTAAGGLRAVDRRR